MTSRSKNERQKHNDLATAENGNEVDKKQEQRFCREYWTGDSKDGQYTNGDGYHYYKMRRNGDVLDAFEYYETDDGEEHAAHLPELIGVNWFSYFGFEDDELLENVAEQEYEYVRNLPKVDDDGSQVAR